MMQIQPAERKAAKLRMALTGPSGSGKTYSALLFARGLVESWEKILLIDTENGSGHLYAALGTYHVLGLTAPFCPERYIEAIQTGTKAGFEVIIIDSLTPEWTGDGGILDVQGKLADTKYRGNSWSAWREVTPKHNALIEAIQQSPAHMIATLRVKVEYLQSDENGKKKIQKIGTAPVQREGLEHEFDLVFDLNAEHLAYASKDRTSLFDGQSMRLSEEAGRSLRNWLHPQPQSVVGSVGTVSETKRPRKVAEKEVAPQPAPPVVTAVPANPSPIVAEEYIVLSAEKVRAPKGAEYVKLLLSLDGRHYTVWGQELSLVSLKPGTLLKAELKQNKGIYYIETCEIIAEAVA